MLLCPSQRHPPIYKFSMTLSCTSRILCLCRRRDARRGLKAQHVLGLLDVLRVVHLQLFSAVASQPTFSIMRIRMGSLIQPKSPWIQMFNVSYSQFALMVAAVWRNV